MQTWVRLFWAVCGVLFFAGASVAASPADESAAGRVSHRVLVTSFYVNDGAPLDEAAVRGVLAGRLARASKIVQLRTFDDVQASFDHAALRDMLGQPQPTDLSTLVDADSLIFGRVETLGAFIQVSVRVLNVQTGAADYVIARRVKAGSADTLLLPLLDQLGDDVAAYLIRTHATGESDKMRALRARKRRRGWKPVHPQALLGASTLALGLGVAGVGGLWTGLDASTASWATLGAGAALATAGGVVWLAAPAVRSVPRPSE